MGPNARTIFKENDRANRVFLTNVPGFALPFRYPRIIVFQWTIWLHPVGDQLHFHWKLSSRKTILCVYVHTIFDQRNHLQWNWHFFLRNCLFFLDWEKKFKIVFMSWWHLKKISWFFGCSNCIWTPIYILFLISIASEKDHAKNRRSENSKNRLHD